MAKMVPAWDKRTGKAVPDPVNGGQLRVPEKWFRNGTFPRLAKSQQEAAAAVATKTKSAGAGEKKGA